MRLPLAGWRAPQRSTGSNSTALARSRLSGGSRPGSSPGVRGPISWATRTRSAPPRTKVCRRMCSRLVLLAGRGREGGHDVAGAARREPAAALVEEERWRGIGPGPARALLEPEREVPAQLRVDGYLADLLAFAQASVGRPCAPRAECRCHLKTRDVESGKEEVHRAPEAGSESGRSGRPTENALVEGRTAPAQLDRESQPSVIRGQLGPMFYTARHAGSGLGAGIP